MSDALPTEVLSLMGVIAFERDENGVFHLRGAPPLWYVRLFPTNAYDDVVPVSERFPFLESFLPTAENFWGAGNPGRIRSGFWVETLPGDHEVPLEASAAVTASAQLLLIEHVRSDFQRIKGLLQKAREKDLEHEQAESYRESLQAVRARSQALLNALPGTVLRVRSDGTVLEHANTIRLDDPIHIKSVVAPGVAECLLEEGQKALQSGQIKIFAYEGAKQAVVAPISGDEYWAVLQDA